MAESNRAPIYNKTKEMTDNETKMDFDEIREIQIELTQESSIDSTKQIHGCDTCMVKTFLTLSLYLCYACETYLCEKCLKRHDKNHAFVKIKSKESKRRGKAASLVFGLREENKIKRGEKLYGEAVEVIGRVHVKHELDKKECRISGLFGLDTKHWVAVDRNNNCLKIFSSTSNRLQRYIKFGSAPRVVTEINIRQKSTNPDSKSGSKTNISGAARDELAEHRLLAIGFPLINQIWFIDISNTPAVKNKTIQMKENCLSFDVSEDKIFTLCRDIIYSINILSIDGNKLRIIQNPALFVPNIRDFVVYNGRIYLSGIENHKVLCIDVEDGKTISKLEIEGSWRAEISVDHNNGVLYLCGNWNNKVYKLSPDLHKYEPLSLDTAYTEKPASLCFSDNKLFISHGQSSSLGNIVTVVHLLT